MKARERQVKSAMPHRYSLKRVFLIQKKPVCIEIALGLRKAPITQLCIHIDSILQLIKKKNYFYVKYIKVVV